MKTLAEIYLPAERLLINQLCNQIQDLIKEKKKIPYLDSDNNPKEESLEYFIMTDGIISFNKRGGNKTKDKVTVKELKDAIKLTFRTEEEFTRTGFNKMFGKSNFAGTPLYLFINLVVDEIKKHRIVGQEVSHQSFGKGIISRIDLQNDSVWFKYNDELKSLSMEYFSLEKEDEEKIKGILANV
ncbi:MAG: hypothetical protein RDU14_03605 [Melioribacteraceae bacterium]|nr:hypothetical protein [Melioribacteraceae bacterium]